MKRINFDYAARTYVDPEVKRYISKLEKDYYYNPSANYSEASQASKKIEESKKIIADIIGAKSTEIIFTSGGSESNNLAIKGVLDQFPQCKILISVIEHESVIEPSKNYQNDKVLVNNEGLVNLEDLTKKIDDETVLISIIHANNEIGTIQPIKQIASKIKTILKDRKNRGVNTPLYFHTDACQSAGLIDIHVHNLGVDLLTLNGNKIYGPAQTGVLYVSSKVSLKPQIEGGNQQRGMRSGTLYAPYIYGLAKAVEMAQKTKKSEVKRLSELQKILIKNINENFEGSKINGSTKMRLPNNLNVTLNGVSAERLLIELDNNGILASAGSACSASNEQSSHVLEAIGLSKKDIDSTIRFSFGRNTSEDDIHYLVRTLKKIIKT